jgi:hypothetical protein
MPGEFSADRNGRELPNLAAVQAVMPHFFFHVRGPDQSLSRDALGLAFPDVEAAYLEVFHAAQDIRDVFAVCGQNPRDYAIEVMNVSDELVFDLPFSEVLSP